MKCDYCSKKAEYNVQSVVKVFTIDKKDNYSDYDEWPDNELNIHVCAKHYQKWQNGDLC